MANFIYVFFYLPIYYTLTIILIILLFLKILYSLPHLQVLRTSICRQISVVTVAPPSRDAPLLGKRQFQQTVRPCHLQFRRLHRRCQNSAPISHCHLHLRRPYCQVSIIIHSHKWSLLGRPPCTCHRLCEHQRQNYLVTVLNCYLNKRSQRQKRK